MGIRAYSGLISGLFRAYFGLLPGLFRAYSGLISGLFWGVFRASSGPTFGPTRTLYPATFCFPPCGLSVRDWKIGQSFCCIALLLGGSTRAYMLRGGGLRAGGRNCYEIKLPAACSAMPACAHAALICRSAMAKRAPKRISARPGREPREARYTFREPASCQ